MIPSASMFWSGFASGVIAAVLVIVTVAAGIRVRRSSNAWRHVSRSRFLSSRS